MPSCVARPVRGRGFALLITITLVAFLVLVLVSLATLTRVETRVAENSQTLSMARANALYALNLALGQLQKYAGPDQAVTARADINPTNTGNPMWTGVWDSVPKDSAGVVLATPTHDPVSAPPSTAPMAWLVSGNETNGTALTPDTAAVASPDIDSNNVWLLHDVVSRDITDTTEYAYDMGVRLKKSPMKIAPNLVPGAGSSGADVEIGAYAWWVGDEGGKARINLADPYRTAAITDAEAAYRREAAPRPDLTLLDGTVYQSVFTNPSAAFESRLEGVLSYEQLPFLNADLSGGDGLKQTAGYFHDLTLVGQGVLADTMRGGLRRDLTRGLDATPTPGSVAEAEIGDDKETFVIPTPGPYGRTALGPVSALWTPGKEPPAPYWSQVRAWYANRAPADGVAMDPVSAPLTGGGSGTLPSIDGSALVPLPAAVQIGYGVDIVDSKLRLTLLPRVVLINPYNVSLAKAHYTVCYIPSVTNTDDWRVVFSLTNTDDSSLKTTATMGLSAWLPQRRLAFNIEDSFEPGEVRIYSMDAGLSEDAFTDGLVELKSGVSTVCAYAQIASPPSASWFADPSKVSAQLTSMPRDHPRITLSVGETKLVGGALDVPSASIHARYIQAEAGYVNPAKAKGPRGNVGDGSAKMLRMLRFSLRDGSLDRISNGNSQASYSYVGATTSADSTSGVRMIIDQNPRAVLSQIVGGWGSVGHYVATVADRGSLAAEIDSDGDNAFWGGSAIGDEYGTSRTIFFDVLRANEQIVSLARLGQFNWSTEGKGPAYPLGNSFASVFYQAGSPDYGYALNEGMWDRFFFSTLPTSLTVRPANLPDSRLRFYDPVGASASLSALEGVNGYQLAATRLMVDGAFNINSTSVEAWTAFLGSVQQSDYAYKTNSGNRTDADVRPFPRVQNLHDPDPTASGQSGKLQEWTGYRCLTGDQLKSLATEIVAGIKARGRPARSLAEFINRDLSKPSTDKLNQMGLVQAAIDTVINTAIPDETGGGTGLAALKGLNVDKIVPTTFSVADNPDAARGQLRTTGALGFLMQNDLLAPLVPAMSARSDTFRVRAYGEVRNPVTQEITGRAWCEAVVQRTPEFVGGESAELSLSDAALGAASKAFGRKFVVTQFRWLAPDEI